jgi:multicomponent Na+:H+ antiporter subunit G
MGIILQYVGYFLVSLGALFLFLGALGLFRMPDFYTRIQAGTKSSTLGAMSFIFGIGLIQPEWFFKTLVIVVFIAISNPISSHALARGAYKSKHQPLLPDGKDAYKKVDNEQNMEGNS